jgi:hypothetical protein
VGEIINVTFGLKPSDGGKARIRRRREALAISEKEILDDLVMDHADPALEMPSDVAP